MAPGGNNEFIIRQFNRQSNRVTRMPKPVWKCYFTVWQKGEISAPWSVHSYLLPAESVPQHIRRDGRG